MLQLSNDEWEKKLTPEQYEVLRRGATEAPFSGKLLHNDETGDYACAACGQIIFKSGDKYDTSTLGLTGWPSFSAAADRGAVELKPDNSWGMHRTEVVCSNCGSHLGHLFDDASSPTGQHFCINSVALNFDPKK
jgi:peptide-methionine (R)-S-oxide reductase